MEILYQDLYLHFEYFTSVDCKARLIRISKRLPRKLKKKINTFVGPYGRTLPWPNRRWNYLWKVDSNYPRFIIKLICDGFEPSKMSL